MKQREGGSNVCGMHTAGFDESIQGRSEQGKAQQPREEQA
jgi:hypothetical protein